MKRKRAILLSLVVLVLAGASYHLLKPTSLDFSKDEEPFRSMVMPLKKVEGTYYMDGGSVTLQVVDAKGYQYEVTFPIDHDSRDAHPTAFQGSMRDRGHVPNLRNPARAKAIAIQLLKDHDSLVEDPVSGMEDINEITRQYLSPPLSDVLRRTAEKVEHFLKRP